MMTEQPKSHAIKRGFFSVAGREVHYRVVGSGPPALFIHSSPTNGSYVVPDMLAQADAYTCYAFDTPGFGLSDPLPLAEMTVADLADATKQAMDALGLPPLPVFGTHSGAAIALELGYRHPDRVTGLMLDGVPIFTREEIEPWRESYFTSFDADALGGHYAAAWTRFRDQSLWFPWSVRRPENLNEYDLAAPDVTHRWLLMFFAAAAYYKPAYWAATSYCEAAVEAARGLQVPATFTATEVDMLYPHLKRLPPLKDGQTIEGIGNDHGRKRALTTLSFARFGSPGAALPSEPAIVSGSGIKRQFVMDGARPQMIRYAGDRSDPPILLLHDAPGSSLMIEPLIGELAADHFVIAPDLPGSGESAGLGAQDEMDAYAAAMWRLCDALGMAGPLDIRGIGFGASLAVEMAVMAPTRCAALAVDGLLLPSDAERAEMLDRYAPPVVIDEHGAHWGRLWHMLRDSRIYWPWYDTRRIALRRVAENFNAESLHDWTTEVMKQSESYPHFIRAALRHDAGARLDRLRVPLTVVADPLSRFAAAYGDRLSARLSVELR